VLLEKNHITPPIIHGANSKSPKPNPSLLVNSPEAVAKICLK